jgi:hypothetical protein
MARANDGGGQRQQQQHANATRAREGGEGRGEQRGRGWDNDNDKQGTTTGDDNNNNDNGTAGRGGIDETNQKAQETSSDVSWAAGMFFFFSFHLFLLTNFLVTNYDNNDPEPPSATQRCEPLLAG